MALLLLRHAVTVPESEGDSDEDASTFLTVSRISESFCCCCCCRRRLIYPFLIVHCYMAAFLASGCWVSSAMLYNGLGHQHLAASKAKTGLSSFSFACLTV